MSMTAPAPSINDPATWGPNVPPPILALETMAFAGNCLASVFYGITVVLFVQCTGALFVSPSPIKRALLIYVGLTFTLSTLYTAFNLRIFQRSYVENRNFPGSSAFPPGPQGYLFFNYSHWAVILPNACFIVSNWMADGLLMFRCFILYGRQQLVLIFPALMYMASISLGVITLYKTSRPDSSLWSGISFDFALPYFVISVSLNILLTLLMSFRLVRHLAGMKKHGTRSNGSSRYGDIVTILVESCALYAISSVLFIGTYGAGHDASTIFLPILSQTQIIAPFLVILRVATNRSVTDTTMKSSSTKTGIVFAHTSTTRMGSTSNGETTKLSHSDSDKYPEMDIRSYNNSRKGTTTV